MVKSSVALILTALLLIIALASWSEGTGAGTPIVEGVSEVWKFVAIGAISAVVAGGATPLVWGFSIDRRIAELKQSIIPLEEFRRWFNSDFKEDLKILKERAHSGYDLGNAAKAGLEVVHEDLKEIKTWIRDVEAKVDGRKR